MKIKYDSKEALIGFFVLLFNNVVFKQRIVGIIVKNYALLTKNI